MLHHIHHSNLIENIDDPEEDAQSCDAWAYLLQQDVITKGVICKLQKIITLHQTDLRPDQRGYYRPLSQCNVRVGDRSCPPWQEVEKLMRDWQRDMRSWEKQDPKEMHIRFERIHPFRDGNGRTGRMLMWWHECKLGRDPTFLDFADRQSYYRWFVTEEERIDRLMYLMGFEPPRRKKK